MIFNHNYNKFLFFGTLRNLLNNVYIVLAKIFDINQNIIQIDNNKNIKLFNPEYY